MTSAEIRVVRDCFGLTQAELARAMEVTVRAVRYWESGERRSPPELLRFFENLAKEIEREATRVARDWSEGGYIKYYDTEQGYNKHTSRKVPFCCQSILLKRVAEFSVRAITNKGIKPCIVRRSDVEDVDLRKVLFGK